MTKEDLLLRAASAIPASLGAWAGAGLFLWIFRVRDATLRSFLWTWAAAAPLLALVGLPAGGVLALRLVVPRDWPPFRDEVFATTALALWTAAAAALTVRRAVRDARLLRCLAGIALAAPAPAELVDAVDRTARWLGVAPPTLAAAETDGAAFVAGARTPFLFVPLALWRRLDARGRRAMLLHEMAHVRRRDPMRLRVLSHLLDLLWPAFPLRWTAARLRDSWEAQADEEAVHDGATRTALARSLVEAWSAPSPADVLAFGGGSPKQRLAALRRRPRASALALQTALLAWCVPWWPAPDDWGVSCRMERSSDDGDVGVVAVGFGCRNPLVDPSGTSRSESSPEVELRAEGR